MSTIVSCLFGYYLDISFIFYAISDCRLNVLHVFLFHKKCCLYRYNVYIEGIIKYERWNIRRIIRQIPLLVISFEYMYIKFVGSKFMSWQRILWPQILFRGNEPEAAPCISTTFINTVIAIIIYKTVAKTRQTKFKILIVCWRKRRSTS